MPHALSPGPKRRERRFPFPQERRLPFFLALLGAAGLHFGLPGSTPHLPPLALLFPLCLYRLSAISLSDRQAFAYGWAAGFLGNCAGLYWMAFPMHDVAGMPFLLAVPCVMLLFAYLACYAGLTTLGMRRLQRVFIPDDADASVAVWRLLLPPLLGGAVFAGFEILCGTLFSGFPWLSLSTAFAFLPVWIQGASLVGGYGLTAALAAAACCAAALFQPLRRGAAAAMILCAALLLAWLPCFGLQCLAAADSTDDGQAAFTLIMVQGNIDQSQKWEPALQQETIQQYIALSGQALRACPPAPASGPVLLLWPETAMPFYFPQHWQYANALRRFARENGVFLAFGALGMEYVSAPPGQAGDRLYNRLYLLSPTGDTIGFYEKSHLVPFGEFIPFAADIPFLRDILQGMSFSSGVVTAPVRLPLKMPDDGATSASADAVSLGVLICYEAIFPELAQKRVEEGAEILVNISNDGWFRASSAPWQHLSHAVLRAVEQGRPMLRSTNTGVSVVITQYGQITARLDALFTAGSLTAQAFPATGTTLFHRLHPALEIVLAALALLSLFSYKLCIPYHRNSHVSAP